MCGAVVSIGLPHRLAKIGQSVDQCIKYPTVGLVVKVSPYLKNIYV